MNKCAMAIVIGSAFLAGCVAPQTKALRAAVTDKPVAPTVMTAEEAFRQLAAQARQQAASNATPDMADVPFFLPSRQPCAASCAAEALATMLAFAGQPTTPATLAVQLSARAPQSSMAVAITKAARAQGRLVYVLAPTLSAVFAAVEQGQPVLVQQRFGLAMYSAPHFAVVVGVDRAHEQVFLRSGHTARLALSFSRFERAWANGEYWAVLVLNPARVPSTLDAGVIIKSLAMMEEAGAVRDAQAGFSRAVLNWPERKTAWLGLASTSRTLGDKALAESTLRELVRREPTYGPGLNNLADFLLQENQPQEAQVYAQRAVSVMLIPETRATLAAVQAALSPYRQRDEAAQVHAREQATQAAQEAVQVPFKRGAAPAP